ncbi:hypothetical protein [Aureivirga sp. CE67]|uniref:hypothetical protein n=1 Tax=Aureivirga sp. CE67 TaxID=1788983 RepID=UPI0018CAB4CE|nr:hypothetical protein [Aureivirga sp. CE67]
MNKKVKKRTKKTLDITYFILGLPTVIYLLDIYISYFIKSNTLGFSPIYMSENWKKSTIKIDYFLPFEIKNLLMSYFIISFLILIPILIAHISLSYSQKEIPKISLKQILFLTTGFILLSLSFIYPSFSDALSFALD